MTDPYQILGISSDATDEQVKKAYKEMSRKYHPDAYVNNPLSDLAEEKFKEVQEAYTQIMNSRANGGFQQGSGQTTGYNQGYGSGQTTGYNQGTGYGQNTSYNNRGQYQNYGNQYGRNPYGNQGSECGTGNLCCDLWCADTMCECMGGDLCGCI